LWLGVNAAATFGPDAGLGENGLPPAGVTGVFDARFVSPRGDTVGFDQGRMKDIRYLATNCQLDTFKVSFQPGNGSTVTFSWGALASYCAPTGWRLTSDLSDAPEVDVDMTTAGSVTVTYDELAHFVYIRKADGTKYRTFDMNTLALDGTVDAKGKKSYGKSYKATNRASEFTALFVNTTGAMVNDLHIEFSAQIDSATLDVSDFPTWSLVKAKKYDKWNFAGASIAAGETVVVHGYGLGTKAVKCSWYWTLGGVLAGTKQKVGNFTHNILRLPMPNSVNAGEQMMVQAYPNKTDFLVMGVANSVKPIIPYVTHKKYADVLKSLVTNAGKFAKGVSTQILHDTMATKFDKKDDKKLGLRGGKPLAGKYTSMAPSVHRNLLFGQALALAVNVQFSATQKTPAGLGALQINIPGSPFNGNTVDTLLAKANQFLTYGTGSATAAELAAMCKQVNEEFTGDVDTSAWGGGKVYFTGAKGVGFTGGWLVRTGATAKVIADLASNNSDIPVSYSLNQNYPNPFNPTTNISFTLPVNGLVTVKVFNLLGQEVATLANQEEFNAGLSSVEFNASSLSSGVYFYRINVTDVTTGEVSFQDLKKMVLLK
jgi:hypothetical protein